MASKQMVLERGGKSFSYIQDFLKFLNHFSQQIFVLKGIISNLFPLP